MADHYENEFCYGCRFYTEVSEASRSGVKVDLIVRGICCILPGVTGYTENVRVMSVVGRYLEHPRIFSFGSGNDQKIYIGSADMMTRNTEKRVEVAAPDTGSGYLQADQSLFEK